MADLPTLHAAVWSLRGQLSDVWQTPNRLDALRFAATESAEAIDAELRKDPRWARNNAKDLSVEEELAQCAIMLLTALGPNPDPAVWTAENTWTDGNADLEAINYRVATALHITQPLASRMMVIGALCDIAQVADLDTLIPAQLERFREKWGKK